MNNNLQKVFSYFSFFSYDPSFDEIYRFYPKKITKHRLMKLLDTALKNKKCKSYSVKSIKKVYLDCHNNIIYILRNLKFVTDNMSFYTLPQYSINERLKTKKQNAKYFKSIVRKVQLYLTFVSLLPYVRLLAVSGSAAMIHASPRGDLDLFIVSKQGTLWTTRMLLVSLAKLMGLYGRYICLNLFFDESDVKIHLKKRNAYIAHELHQIIPLIDKNAHYNRLLAVNTWTSRFFPNTKPHTIQTIKYTMHNVSFITRFIESLSRTIQLPIIRNNKTGMYITKTQLWLFKHDFEKSLRNSNLI